MAPAPAPWAGTSAGPITARPEVPLARPAYAPQQLQQPTPPAGPAWYQPPANPPPVPPPSAASMPPEPPAVRPIAWSPQARSGAVGTAVSSAIDGQLGAPPAKTATGKSLRRVSRVRSSTFALAFLCVAAVFLVGVLVILILTLAR